MSAGQEVAAALRGVRFVQTGEAGLQEAIADLLRSRGYAAEREVVIGDGCRVDLLVGRVGVEVKAAGTAVEVCRQVRRYLATGALDHLVLVTRRVSHLNVPHLLADDRVLVVALPLTGGGL